VWTSVLDEGFGKDFIYLDYRKAFDTVPYNRLILALNPDKCKVMHLGHHYRTT